MHVLQFSSLYSRYAVNRVARARYRSSTQALLMLGSCRLLPFCAQEKILVRGLSEQRLLRQSARDEDGLLPAGHQG